MAECPYIDRSFVPNPEYNTPVEYTAQDGSVYTFYRHDDGFGKLSNVQFCRRIGRKTDVFECLNECEWRECYAYQSAKESDEQGRS